MKFPALILFLTLLLTPGAAYPFCFEEAGAAYGISPVLLRSIADVESGMNPAAVHHNRNGSTDFGLMQINSSWLKPLGVDSGELLSEPCRNVMTGARILRECLDRLGDNWEAIGCYNATTRTKRADYSWKVYRTLRNAGISVTRGESRRDVVKVDTDVTGVVKGKTSMPMVSEMRITDAD